MTDRKRLPKIRSGLALFALAAMAAGQSAGQAAPGTLGCRSQRDRRSRQPRGVIYGVIAPRRCNRIAVVALPCI